jgi:hypothetical protein
MKTIKNLADKAKSSNRHEGHTTEAIEQITAGLPSITWLLLAGGSIVASATLKLRGKHSPANFVGEWAPTFLMIGVYNKLVKLMGSDQRETVFAKA